MAKILNLEKPKWDISNVKSLFCAFQGRKAFPGYIVVNIRIR